MKRPLKLLLVASLPLVLLAWLGQKTFREGIALAELQDALKTKIHMKGFQQQPLGFKRALRLIQEECAGQGKSLPILLDCRAFREDTDLLDSRKELEHPGLSDFNIRFPPFPKKMAAATALRLILGNVNPAVAKHGATYVIRPEGVIIIPMTKADRAVLRVYPVAHMVIAINEPTFWEKIREKFLALR